MRKLLLLLISLCGVLTACHRMPSKPERYVPDDSTNTHTDTVPAPTPDTLRQGGHRPPTEYKLLYGVRPTPFEQKRMAEDTLKNAKR